MLWIAILLLTLLTLLPCLLLLRHDVELRDPREAALALHRAQLDEVERDRAQGLIAESEHATARLEIQRRLLAAAGRSLPAPRPQARGALLATLLAVPLAALALYLAAGHPFLPSQPAAWRARQIAQHGRADFTLLAQLRDKIASLPPGSPQARQGYLLLGEAEAARGEWADAAQAWSRALDAGFDATLAMQTAEAEARAAGSVTPQAAALFKRALAGAPADASWRLLAEQRIAESEAH